MADDASTKDDTPTADPTAPPSPPPGTRLPTWAQLARRISALYTRDGEWCGLPMAVPRFPLVVEDNHPYAELLTKVQAVVDDGAPPREEEDDPPATAVGDDEPIVASEWTVINAWWGRNRHAVWGTVQIVEHTPTGRRRIAFAPDLVRRFDLLLDGTFAALDVWNVATEATAMARLRTLTTERQFSTYVLTGQFLERSPRSQVVYLFRRLRPTLALSCGSGRSYHPIAALCLHPIAYYADTCCGAMTPTDDVLAHLMMMRADEPMYWRRANQHNPWRPEGGI